LTTLPDHPSICAAMSVDSLEKALRQPRAFSLFLTDGRRIDVPHPEFLWLVPPHRSDLVISHGRRGGTELLRVNQIVSIRWSDNEAA
jgi:hypothetical protein